MLHPPPHDVTCHKSTKKVFIQIEEEKTKDIIGSKCKYILKIFCDRFCLQQWLQYIVAPPLPFHSIFERRQMADCKHCQQIKKHFNKTDFIYFHLCEHFVSIFFRCNDLFRLIFSERLKKTDLHKHIKPSLPPE